MCRSHGAHQMNAAEAVIAKFGDPAVLARIIGKGPSTISYWRKVGMIPAKWQAALMTYAGEMSISLSADDFIAARPAQLSTVNSAEPKLPEFPKATHWGDSGG